MKLVKCFNPKPGDIVWSYSDRIISLTPIKHTLSHRVEEDWWLSEDIGLIKSDNIFIDEEELIINNM
jgi:hypothetical protein